MAWRGDVAVVTMNVSERWNQMLVEMGGFEGGGIIVIAATNRPGRP